jgi:hypothetical protein
MIPTGLFPHCPPHPKHQTVPLKESLKSSPAPPQKKNRLDHGPNNYKDTKT